MKYIKSWESEWPHYKDNWPEPFEFKSDFYPCIQWGDKKYRLAEKYLAPFKQEEGETS